MGGAVEKGMNLSDFNSFILCNHKTKKIYKLSESTLNKVHNTLKLFLEDQCKEIVERVVTSVKNNNNK